MSNISIKIKNFSHNLLGLRNNLVVLFYIGLFTLLVFEGLVVKDAISQVMASRQEQLPSRSVQKVRINFEDYNAVVNKIEQNKNFSPNLSPKQNPFKSK